MTDYDVTVIDWDGDLVYRQRHSYRCPQRALKLTPSTRTCLICVTTPDGDLLAVAGMPHLHPSDQPPVIHLKLEYTRP